MKYKHNEGVKNTRLEKILVGLAILVIIAQITALIMAYFNTKPGVSLTQTIIAGLE